MKEYINLSSFRRNILDALLQFSEQVEEEPEEIAESRTAKDWWEEFKLYMEDV